MIKFEIFKCTLFPGGPIKTSGGGMKIDCKDMSQKNNNSTVSNTLVDRRMMNTVLRFIAVDFRGF